MNEKRRPMTDAEHRAREALESLTPFEADPAFRARLKEEFLAGQVEEPAPSRHWPSDVRPRPRWRLVLGLVTTAVAAALIMAFLFGIRGPRWTLEKGSGEGQIRIGARTFPLDRLSELADFLVPGARLTTEGTAEITLRAGDQMVLVLAPESELTLPDTFGRWFSSDRSLQLVRGEVRVTTLSGFSPANLLCETEESMVRITGTTLAVIRNDQGTCLCVLEGEVEMMDRVGEGKDAMSRVPEGMRRVAYSDGRESAMAPLEPLEEIQLQKLREAFRR